MVNRNIMNPIKQKLLKLKSPIRAKLLAGFFKTGKGEYGEGDIFWGITVPEQRVVAKEFAMRLHGGAGGGGVFSEDKEILQELLKDPVHECRFTALLILTYLYEKAEKNKKNKGAGLASEIEKKKIFDFYIKNIKYINNWDLVDVTCHRIIGAYLYDKDRELLYRLARSKNLWEKRIAIVSTFHFIAKGDFSDSLKIGEMLLLDKHDLIHKAVGWMLREVGKKDEVVLHNFLKKHCKTMARTTLRYSIERLPEDFRRHYMRQ
ncbi:MAG: DNA alkylation repair protein [bacterium]